MSQIEEQILGVEQGAPVDDFTAWCRDHLFTPQMIEAAGLLQRACDLHLARLYRNLHLPDYMCSPKTATELAADLGYVDSARIVLEAMLLRLSERTGLVRAQQTSGETVFQAADNTTEDTDAELDSLRKRLSVLGKNFGAALEFIDFGAEHFVYSLRDDPAFMDKVLSGRDPQFYSLWFRATNEDCLQDVHGIMGAELVHRIFPGGRILEIGGGTGNGMRHLLRRFAETDSLERIKQYVFTDVSMNFLIGTRQELRKLYPTLKTEWRLLDIDRPFLEQKVAPNSADLIYGVNGAHVCRDIVETLRQCREALSEDGLIVLSERVRMKPREMAPRELTLNLSICHRSAAIRNPEYRPMHSYLSPDNWFRVLDLAGFRSAQVFPNLEILRQVFPDPYAAVIVAKK